MTEPMRPLLPLEKLSLLALFHSAVSTLTYALPLTTLTHLSEEK